MVHFKNSEKYFSNSVKDDDLRKKYDKWGEKGLEDDFNPNRGRYESWNFYHEEFGLYDNDEDIEVLDRGTLFEAMASNDLWFIKFYSERQSSKQYFKATF